MMVSVIVPALNEEHFIKNTLSRLTALTGNFEVIVVDGGSTDDTPQIVSAFKEVQLITAEKGRAVQMNTGAARAKGETLLFLHADTILPPNAYEVIVNHLQDPRSIGGSFYIQFDEKHSILKFYSWCSKISMEYFTYGDHGMFIRKNVFDSIGGYKSLCFMEDVEIQKRLRKLGKFRKVQSAVTTSARRFNKVGPISQMLINIFLVAGYKLGVPPQKLKVFYKDHFGS